MGFPSAYQPAPAIDYVSPGRPCPQVDSPPVVPPQSSCCTDKVDNVLSQNHNEYLDTQAVAWTSDENMSNYEFDNNHLHPSVDGETTHFCDSGCQQDYHSDPMLSDPLHGAVDNPPGHLPVLQENLPAEAGLQETMAEKHQLAFPATQPMESQVVMAKDLARLQQELQAVQNTLAASRYVLHGSRNTSIPCDPEISVNDEDETCIPSPAALLDHRDITSSLAIEVAECHFHIAQIPASGMGYQHSTQNDIKSHPPDEASLNSHHSSVHTVSPKSPLSADKLARVTSMNCLHNLCPMLYTDEKECLGKLGNKAIDDEPHQPMASHLVTQGSIDPSPTNAQSLASSHQAYRPSLLLSKSLGISASHDENVHHVDPHNPYRVPPPTSRAKLSPTTEKLYDPVDPGITASHFPGTKSPLARAAGYMASDTCLACEVPNRYMVHCHKFYPELLSQVDVSCDILGESDLLQETVSDVSEYMLHAANIPSDSGYHFPH